MSAKEFRLGLDRWFKDEVEDRITDLTRTIAMDALAKIVLKTPVGNPDIWKANKGKKRGAKGRVGKGYSGGRLRGNWLVSIAVPAAGAVDRIDPNGGETIREGRAVIDGLTRAQAIYISNNLPYANAVENGHSQQAPAGMVAITLAELEAKYGRAR